MLKEITPSYPIFNNASMTGSTTITSLQTNVGYKDSVSIELVWTGTPTGNFFVQGSNSYNPGTPQTGTPNAGTWTTIPVVDPTTGQTPQASGQAGQNLINLKQAGFPWIQVVYTNASGTGTLNAVIYAKSLG
jgi:hypothetical protein